MHSKRKNIIADPGMSQMKLAFIKWLKWGAAKTGGKVQINVDNGCEFFRSGESHGFKNPLVNECAQTEYIFPQFFR